MWSSSEILCCVSDIPDRLTGASENLAQKEKRHQGRKLKELIVFDPACVWPYAVFMWITVDFIRHVCTLKRFLYGRVRYFHKYDQNQTDPCYNMMHGSENFVRSVLKKWRSLGAGLAGVVDPNVAGRVYQSIELVNTRLLLKCLWWQHMAQHAQHVMHIQIAPVATSSSFLFWIAFLNFSKKTNKVGVITRHIQTTERDVRTQ